MRQSLLVCTLAAVAFSGHGAEGSFLGEGKVLKERAMSNIHLYNTASGATMVGDTLPFTNTLLDETGEKEVGVVEGICTYLETENLVWECRFTMAFEDGNIMAMGNLMEEQKCSNQVIVGGTGAYVGAEGLDMMCWPQDGSIDYTHNLKLQTLNSPKVARPMTERKVSTAHVYYSNFGVTSIGDTNAYYNALFDGPGENSLGKIFGVCTYLETSPTLWQCQSTYAFADGKVSSFGLLSEDEDCSPQAIAGGTDVYAGAQGVIDLCWPGKDGEYKHGIRMEEPGVKPTGQYSVIERPTTNQHIFNTQEGVISIGDTVPFTNELYDENDEIMVGKLTGICTYLQVNPRVWHCEQTYETKDGQVMATGLFNDVTDCQSFAIVGGNHAFKGADGTVDVCWPESGEDYTHVIKFGPYPQATSSCAKSASKQVLGYLFLASTFLHSFFF